MACASFLKFHPTLPKQGALVITRNLEPPVDKRRQDLTKEERARQRHSVEVTTNAGSYLHIKPATLESLTRSAANANANRNRSKRVPNPALQEEAATAKGSQSDRWLLKCCFTCTLFFPYYIIYIMVCVDLGSSNSLFSFTDQGIHYTQCLYFPQL